MINDILIYLSLAGLGYICIKKVLLGEHKEGIIQRVFLAIFAFGIFAGIYFLLVGLVFKGYWIMSLVVIAWTIFEALRHIKMPKNKEGLKDTEIVNKEHKGTENSFIFGTVKGNFFVDNPFRGIYIQGGAGSGKTASIFEPMIRQAGEQGYSGLLYDFKSPEQIEKTVLAYQNCDIDVQFVNFQNATKSQRANPLDPIYLDNQAYALEFAQIITNNLLPQSIKKPDFWTNSTKMMIAGCLWYLRNKHPDKCSLPHIVSLILYTPIETLIEMIKEDKTAYGFITSIEQSLSGDAGGQKAGVLATVQGALSTLNTPEIFWLLSKNEIDLEVNKNGSVLCVGNDSTLPDTYSPCIALILGVAIRKMNTTGRKKSFVMIDEAPTVYIPNIEMLPATGRSNKIATIIGVQDVAQLIDKYGKDKTETVISNLGTHFYGRTTSDTTAERLSKKFGKEEREITTYTSGENESNNIFDRQGGTSSSESRTQQERDRIKAIDIINLKEGEFLGLIAEGTPREFLQTQFDYKPLQRAELPTLATAQEITDNYDRIIDECVILALEKAEQE